MIDEQKPSEKTLEHPEDSSAMSEQKEQENSPEVTETLTEEVTLDSFDTEKVDSEDPDMSYSSSESGEAEVVIQALQQEISALNERLSKQSEQGDSFKEKYMRLAADFENWRKRVQKEKEDLEQQVKRNTITELLSVVDNFERARSQIKPADDGEMAIHKSYQGVYKQLVDGLKRIGVSAMRPEGQEFDPNLHEAVFREPSSEYAEGIVIEQLVRGYLLGDKVLRHAMVKVAAEQEPTGSADNVQPGDVQEQENNLES